MRKFLCIALMLVASYSMAQNVSLSMKLTNDANFTTDYTLTNSTARCFTVYAPRSYATYQTLTVILHKVSGLTAVKVQLFGAYTLGGDSTQIGSDVDWNCTSETDVTEQIVNTTANLYQYFIVKYTGTGTGTATVTNQNLRLWNGNLTAVGRITAIGGVTVTGAVSNVNASSNFATNIGTGTSTGAIALGGGSNTVAVNSTTWDISAAGVATGFTGITSSKKVAARDSLCIQNYHFSIISDTLCVTKSGGATLRLFPSR